MAHPCRGLTVLVPLMLALGACGSGSSVSPSPSVSPVVVVSPESSPSVLPEPVPSPSLTVKEQHVVEAKAALRDYYAAAGEVATSGYVDWETRLGPYIASPEFHAMLSESVAAESSLGIQFSGGPKVSTMTVTNYIEDPTGYENQRIAMDACIDFASITGTHPDGTPASPPATFIPRSLVQVVMYHMGPQGPWGIGEFIDLGGVPC